MSAASSTPVLHAPVNVTAPGIEAVQTLAGPPSAAASLGAMSPADLAELVTAFNTVTVRLQATHEALSAEVQQLKTELAEANQQVERSRRLAALGEMAAGIAHEIRNPLGSIRLYARMLKDDLADRPPQRETAEKIGSAVTRLDAVVGDVLTFAKEVKPRITLVDSEELLRGALAAARSDGPEWRNLTIEVPVQRGAASIQCDPHLLQQALINLIRNAVEAMHESGSPIRTLTLGARKQRARAHPHMIGLFVQDTGPGIPAGVMERIFNPFFTTRAAGTGLGLAIVHRIAEAHAGSAQVKNVTDGPRVTGALVEIILPA